MVHKKMRAAKERRTARRFSMLTLWLLDPVWPGDLAELGCCFDGCSGSENFVVLEAWYTLMKP